MTLHISIIPDTVARAFPDITKQDMLHMLCQYYHIENVRSNALVQLLDNDAKKNFTTKSEIISRIVRKNLGQPEIPGIQLYPEDKIDDEIRKRIRDIVKLRTDFGATKRYSEIGVCKTIVSSILRVRHADQKSIEVEIKKRCQLTGLSRDEVKRRIYMAYFNLGIDDTSYLNHE